jgi:glycosyltransferase involved in cell wall biosynthesis
MHASHVRYVEIDYIMKILLCHNYYQLPGGEDQVFHDERSLLEDHGHDVITYTKHNDEIVQLSTSRVVRDTFWNRTSYSELRELIRRQRPDLMHCTNIFPLVSPAVYYAARAERVPVVQSLHNYRLLCANGYLLRNGKVCEDCLGKTFSWPAILHGCYRNGRAASAVVAGMQTFHRLLGTWRKAVDRFISCSEFARQKLIESGLSADRISVKPNFVQPDLGPGVGDGNYAVFVGRLSPEKGIDTLLEAWSRMPDAVPLKIMGDGPLSDRVAAAANKDSRIEWLGWQPLEQVLDVVGRASFLLMTSVWYETFGRTIIEAFSKGTPAIVSRLGAMAELVEDGRTGLLFQPGDSHDLVLKIRQLSGDSAGRQRMRGQCRDEFARKYTAAANYQQLIEIYEKALARDIDTRRDADSCVPAAV